MIGEKEMNERFNEIYKFNETFQRSKLEPLAEFNRGKELEKLNGQIHLIDEELQEIKDAIKDGDWEALKDGVMDLLVVGVGLGYVADIDCDKGLREVNRANMSKLCSTQDEVVATTGHYGTLGVECAVQSVGNSLWAIKSTKDQTDTEGNFFPEGKFLKNVNWSTPDLSFIER